MPQNSKLMIQAIITNTPPSGTKDAQVGAIAACIAQVVTSYSGVVVDAILKNNKSTPGGKGQNVNVLLTIVDNTELNRDLVHGAIQDPLFQMMVLCCVANEVGYSDAIQTVDAMISNALDSMEPSVVSSAIFGATLLGFRQLGSGRGEIYLLADLAHNSKAGVTVTQATVSSANREVAGFRFDAYTGGAGLDSLYKHGNLNIASTYTIDAGTDIVYTSVFNSLPSAYSAVWNKDGSPEARTVTGSFVNQPYVYIEGISLKIAQGDALPYQRVKGFTQKGVDSAGVALSGVSGVTGLLDATSNIEFTNKTGANLAAGTVISRVDWNQANVLFED